MDHLHLFVSLDLMYLQLPVTVRDIDTATLLVEEKATAIAASGFRVKTPVISGLTERIALCPV